jgi:hypothetical protein
VKTVPKKPRMQISEKKFSPFYRPLVVGVAFMVFFCGFLVLKGRDSSVAKLALVGGWFLIGAVAMALTQALGKKEFSWRGNFAGVVGIGMVVAGIMLATDH